MSFTEMNINPKLMQSLKKQNFDLPTEIQRKVYPIIMSGRDLGATAETGTGKTLAFVLPTAERLLTPSVKAGIGPRALILTPTRELADQVTDVIKRTTFFTELRFGSITGGVPYYSQEQLLRKPFDFLVATPGRLIDHMNQGRVDFSRLEVLILDEADRMLDMGFMKDIEKILKSIPGDRQILLFSATLEGPIQKIARQFLNKPALVELTQASKPNALISQKILFADDFNHKKALLLRVLEEPSLWQAIVFTATKRGADELADFLYDQKISSAALHGDMRQSKRTRTLARMREVKGKMLRVLVATDVAARGIDVKTISHVINFDLPKTVEDYIHRIGRTGRCGETGVAISLVGPREKMQLSQIERFTGQRLERQVLKGLEPKLREVREVREVKERKFNSRPTHSKNSSLDKRQSFSKGTSSKGNFSKGASSSKGTFSKAASSKERTFSKRGAPSKGAPSKGAFSKDKPSSRRPKKVPAYN